MNIVICGTGSMSKAIEDIVSKIPEYQVLDIVGSSKENLYERLDSIDKKVDVVIDFSNYNNIEPLISYAIKHKTPLVIATTGLSDDLVAKINLASKQIPICYSANMSLGVNVLYEAIKLVSKALDASFDIELIEKHHNQKLDAPSGTAKYLLEAILEGKEEALDVIYGRQGLKQREANEIGVHAIRGGTIVGEHEVIFAGDDEIIEIKHTALSKRLFAKGSIYAAEFVAMQKNGLYSMRDVLFKK